MIALLLLALIVAFQPTEARMPSAYEEAKQTYTVHIDLSVEAIAKAVATGDTLDIQLFEHELATGLDSMESLVLHSCYAGWQRATVVHFELLILAQKLYRYRGFDLGGVVGSAADAMPLLILDTELELEKGCKI